MTGALWVLSGVLLFTIIEKIFSSLSSADENSKSQQMHSDNSIQLNDSDNTGSDLVESRRAAAQPIKISGYLNLMANSIDNFTQGLAVAASFLVSFRQGLLGTIAILCKLKQSF